MSKLSNGDGSTDKNLEHLCLHLKGQVVTVRTKANQDTLYSGIVSKSELTAWGVSLVLTMYHEKGDITSKPNDSNWTIPLDDLLEINVNPLIVTGKKDNSKTGFKTDEEISGAVMRNRELQKWELDDEAMEMLGDEEFLEDGEGEDEDDDGYQKKGRKKKGNNKGKKQQKKKGKEGDDSNWDQFSANSELFGVQSNFQEEYESAYTIALDKNSQFYRERQAHAARLAADIEKSTTSNPHRREERGQIPQADEDDEEELFSSVMRDAPPPGFSESDQVRAGKDSKRGIGIPGSDKPGYPLNLSNSPTSSGANSPNLRSSSSGNADIFTGSGSKYIIPSRRKEDKNLKGSHEGSRSPKTEHKSVSALGLEPPKVSDKVVNEFINFTQDQAKKPKQEEIEQLRRFSEGIDRKKSTGSPRGVRKGISTETLNISGGPTISATSATTSTVTTTTATITSSSGAATTSPAVTSATITTASTSATTTSATAATSAPTTATTSTTTTTATTATTTTTTTKLSGLSLPKVGLNPFAKEFKPSFSLGAAAKPQQPTQPQLPQAQPQPQHTIPAQSIPLQPLPQMGYPFIPYGTVAGVPTPRGISAGVPYAIGDPTGKMGGIVAGSVPVPVPYATAPNPAVAPGVAPGGAAPVIAPGVGLPPGVVPSMNALQGAPAGAPMKMDTVSEMYHRIQKHNDSQPKRKTSEATPIKWGSSNSSSSSSSSSSSGGVSPSNTPPSSPPLTSPLTGPQPPMSSWQVYVSKVPPVPASTMHTMIPHPHIQPHPHGIPVTVVAPPFVTPGAPAPFGYAPNPMQTPIPTGAIPIPIPGATAPVATIPQRRNTTSAPATNTSSAVSGTNNYPPNNNNAPITSYANAATNTYSHVTSPVPIPNAAQTSSATPPVPIPGNSNNFAAPSTNPTGNKQQQGGSATTPRNNNNNNNPNNNANKGGNNNNNNNNNNNKNRKNNKS